MGNEVSKEHYYGDAVRTIFIIVGIVMLVMLPFFSSLMEMSLVHVSIVVILTLAVLAGFLNPRHLWIIALDTVVSIGAFAIFEYYAVHTYLSPTGDLQLSIKFFWINQVLALLSFIAIYLSAKSLRGKILAK